MEYSGKADPQLGRDELEEAYVQHEANLGAEVVPGLSLDPALSSQRALSQLLNLSVIILTCV